MIGFLKSLQSVFASVLTELPDGLKVVTDFLWRCRWFIVGGVVMVGVYNVVMVVLPYLLWSLVIKLVVGSIFSFITL
jgi:hypothetical protein